MNKTGLVFNIILTIMVFFGACEKNDSISYTGLYNAKIQITYTLPNGTIIDSSFSSLLIVNQAYGENKLEVQWTLDNYLRLNGKTIFIPNILQAQIRTNIFDNKRKLVCQDNSCYFDNIEGVINEGEIKLIMKTSNQPIIIKISAIKYQE